MDVARDRLPSPASPCDAGVLRGVRAALAGVWAVWLAWLLANLASCASVEGARPLPDPSPGPRPARVLFVGAHPDDEAMVGPLLAWLCQERDARCHFVVLSLGEESGCLATDGCAGDLRVQRRREMKRVAKRFGATLSQYRFPNAPFHFLWPPAFEDTLADWTDAGQPVDVVAAEIRAFQPDLVVSLDDEHGFTGHPEHRLAGFVAVHGARRARDPAAALDGAPFDVPRVWLAQNRRFPLTVTGVDPKEPDFVFELTRSCGERTCRDEAASIAKLHESQQPYMGLLRIGQLATGAIWIAELRP